jgi:protein TonB
MTRKSVSVPVPDLELKQIDSRPPLGLGLLSFSILLHAGLALAVVVVPILAGDGLPTPPSGLRVFFAAPMVIAPPPLPPPPAAVSRIRKEPPSVPSFTAPTETPEDVVPEKAADLGISGAEAGGVEGGAPGGVVGGIVEPLPEIVPSPPPPVHVGGGIQEPKKLKHVDPVYPEIAVRASVQGNVVVECVVSPRGRVTDVRIVSGIPLLNEAAIAAVRQWVYTPTLVDGVPRVVIMTVTVHFRIK